MSKLNQVIGFLMKEEAAYGTAETLSNTDDAINPFIGDGDPEAPTPIEYVYDGMIGRASGTLAPQKRTTPNGRFRQGELRVLPKGSGATYSISSLPPNEVYRGLVMAGFAWTYSATPTPQWTATPVAAGTIVGTTLRQFAQGSQYDQAGVIADMSFETQGLGVPVWTFNWRGVASAPTDQAFPTLTIGSAGVIPPVASAVVDSIGGVTSLVVRRATFRLNRSVDNPRVAITLAGGHAGFIPGGMRPELELEIERPARSGYDPEAKHAAATSEALSLQFGATQYNRWSVSLPQAQVSNVQPGNEGPNATVVVTYTAHASTPSANDFLSFLFN